MHHGDLNASCTHKPLKAYQNFHTLVNCNVKGYYKLTIKEYTSRHPNTIKQAKKGGCTLNVSKYHIT